MPIRKENTHRYGGRTVWLRTVDQVRQRATINGVPRCEECKVPNHGVITRNDVGRWHLHAVVHTQREAHEECAKIDPAWGKPVWIICTVAHLDDTVGLDGLYNNDPSNLKYLCQRDHNRYDAERRAAGIKARKEA